MELPKLDSIFNFHKIFPDEEHCRRYISMLRWNSWNPPCPKCGKTDRIGYLKTNNFFKCYYKDCKRQFTVLTGTIFQRSRVPIKKWFYMMAAMITFRFVGQKIASTIFLSETTAINLFRKIRMSLALENQIPVLKGEIQIDETYIGAKAIKDMRVSSERKAFRDFKKKGTKHYNVKKLKEKVVIEPGKTKEIFPCERNHTKYTNFKAVSKTNDVYNVTAMYDYKSWEDKTILGDKVAVLGMLQKNGPLLLVDCGPTKKKVSGNVMKPHILKHVHKDSIVITDKDLNFKYFQDYFVKHHTVIHKYREYKDKYNKGTNGIENVWKHLKRKIISFHMGISKKNVKPYLHEFVFFYNRSGWSLQDIFYDMINYAVKMPVEIPNYVNEDAFIEEIKQGA